MKNITIDKSVWWGDIKLTLYKDFISTRLSKYSLPSTVSAGP